MAQFFFHLTNGELTIPDAAGVMLDDETAARRHLIERVGSMKSLLSDKGIYDLSDWAVLITDGNNRTLELRSFRLIPRI